MLNPEQLEAEKQRAEGLYNELIVTLFNIQENSNHDYYSAEFLSFWKIFAKDDVIESESFKTVAYQAWQFKESQYKALGNYIGDLEDLIEIRTTQPLIRSAICSPIRKGLKHLIFNK